MMKYALVFIFLFATVYSFAVEDEDLSLLDSEADLSSFDTEAMIPEESRSLRPGSECNGHESDCQCYGKWHKCSCPYFWPLRSGKCYCEKGWKHTCIKKLHCPNKDEWGLDWRSEESERSPC